MATIIYVCCRKRLALRGLFITHFQIVLDNLFCRNLFCRVVRGSPEKGTVEGITLSVSGIEL
jgi:hypothetical protein